MIIIGHRAARATRPENTIATLREGEQVGGLCRDRCTDWPEGNTINTAVRIPASYIHPQFMNVIEELTGAAHKSGLHVITWTIKQRRRANESNPMRS